MTKNNTINLEIQPAKCFKLFDQSFRRIKYFACIADNIEIDNLPADWKINNDTGIGYGMTEPSEEDKKKLLHGFKYFLRRYLVRDCIESFALCLDKLCFTLLLLSEEKRKIQKEQTLYDTLNDDEKEFLKNFQTKGVSPKDGKIKLLEKQFNLKLSEDKRKVISGLKDIRDCLTHRNGIVSERDGAQAEDGKRRFHWVPFEFFIVDGKTGEELQLEIGKVYKNGGDLCMRFVDRTKLFSIGEQLSFTSAEAYEIALSLQFAAREYLGQIDKEFVPDKVQPKRKKYYIRIPIPKWLAKISGLGI